MGWRRGQGPFEAEKGLVTLPPLPGSEALVLQLLPALPLAAFLARVILAVPSWKGSPVVRKGAAGVIGGGSSWQGTAAGGAGGAFWFREEIIKLGGGA